MQFHSIFPRPIPHHSRRQRSVDLWTRELALFRHPPKVQLSSPDEEAESEVVSLSEGAAVIGRSPTADLHLRDQWVSRRQCAIQLAGEIFSIRDLESRHGTYVNDEKVSHAKLRDGDVIRVGLTLLTVRYLD